MRAAHRSDQAYGSARWGQENTQRQPDSRPDPQVPALPLGARGAGLPCLARVWLERVAQAQGRPGPPHGRARQGAAALWRARVARVCWRNLPAKLVRARGPELGELRSAALQREHFGRKTARAWCDQPFEIRVGSGRVARMVNVGAARTVSVCTPFRTQIPKAPARCAHPKRFGGC